jgi:predicted N-formylglutamate amidohydrolase
MTLLSQDEPAAFEVVQGGAVSPFFLVCDHAGRRVPRALGSLGLSEHDLERHIAWDIGAAGFAQKLAGLLDAFLILQNYSRLVIDCNRPRTSPDSIVRKSEDTLIPGNQDVSAAEAELRAAQIFEPYHARIRSELDARAAAGQASVLIFVHSFTPVFRSVARAWHAAVLYNEDARLARPLLAALRREPELTIGENEPYAASALTDYGLVEHAERRGLPYVELEIRQDLLADERGQKAWAERLARLLNESGMFPT